MTLSAQNPQLSKTAAMLGLWIVALSFMPMAFADEARDNLINEMKGRQQEVANSYNDLSYRVNNIDANDPRKSPPKDKDGKPLWVGANALLDVARNAKDAFENLRPEDNLIQINGTLTPNPAFTTAEKTAIEAMNAVNRFLLAPVQPGAKSLGREGTVPKGDLVEDFLPQLIRLLFRFTSVAVLISFVVSGVLFIIAFDNTEFTDKAKRMLYYSILGFAFVTLAYAIVKGVTQVNYFGII